MKGISVEHRGLVVVTVLAAQGSKLEHNSCIVFTTRLVVKYIIFSVTIE
jgi:hypothetical protein